MVIAINLITVSVLININERIALLLVTSVEEKRLLFNGIIIDNTHYINQLSYKNYVLYFGFN